ncbi:MAG TPA: ComF family protein [Longimicrobiales bacterium]|nr:ComF family protein [Longimicrobiales bacterium]
MWPLLRGLAELVFSPVCLGCDAPVLPAADTPLVCARCRARMPPPAAPRCRRCDAPLVLSGRAAGATCTDCDGWEGALTRAVSACVLQPPADRLVHRLKYGGWRALAGPMADLMARALPRVGRAGDAGEPVLVPVPTTRTRLRARGYDQASLLAAALARRASLRAVGALERTVSRGSQTALQPSARRANVAGVFRPTPAMDPIRGRRVLLVDDVLTTGATAGECARVLAEAGAADVALVSFARALDARRSDPR